jgi:hypothetical protein
LSWRESFTHNPGASRREIAELRLPTTMLFEKLNP